MPFRRSIYKSPAELRSMVAPGLLTASALPAVRDASRPGVTPHELDAKAEQVIPDRRGIPNFQLVPGYRHTLCVSVNDDVVHGIPSSVPIEAGDIVSVDAGAEVDGWNGDSAITVVVPDETRPELVATRERLSQVTEGSLWAGVARLASARHLNEVGDAVQAHVEQHPAASGEGYGILTDYVGHGIGRTMHEDPPVFNYRVRQKGPDIKAGLVVAIEPMVVEGAIDTIVQDDDWTVSTEDGRDAAHWEHSVAVHRDGIWVLTATDGGRAGLAPFGITPVPVP